jgi:hypothetical protein
VIRSMTPAPGDWQRHAHGTVWDTGSTLNPGDAQADTIQGAHAWGHVYATRATTTPCENS